MKVGRLPGNFFFNLDFRKMSAVRKSKGGGDAGEIFYVRFAF